MARKKKKRRPVYRTGRPLPWNKEGGSHVAKKEDGK